MFSYAAESGPPCGVMVGELIHRRTTGVARCGCITPEREQVSLWVVRDVVGPVHHDPLTRWDRITQHTIHIFIFFLVFEILYIL